MEISKKRDAAFKAKNWVELERLNQFPDNHTKGATDNKRAFFMGNALVVGVVKKLSKSLLKSLN